MPQNNPLSGGPGLVDSWLHPNMTTSIHKNRGGSKNQSQNNNNDVNNDQAEEAGDQHEEDDEPNNLPPEIIDPFYEELNDPCKGTYTDSKGKKRKFSDMADEYGFLGWDKPEHEEWVQSLMSTDEQRAVWDQIKRCWKKKKKKFKNKPECEHADTLQYLVHPTWWFHDPCEGTFQSAKMKYMKKHAIKDTYDYATGGWAFILKSVVELENPEEVAEEMSSDVAALEGVPVDEDDSCKGILDWLWDPKHCMSDWWKKHKWKIILIFVAIFLLLSFLPVAGFSVYQLVNKLPSLFLM